MATFGLDYAGVELPISRPCSFWIQRGLKSSELNVKSDLVFQLNPTRISPRLTPFTWKHFEFSLVHCISFRSLRLFRVMNRSIFTKSDFGMNRIEKQLTIEQKKMDKGYALLRKKKKKHKFLSFSLFFHLLLLLV